MGGAAGADRRCPRDRELDVEIVVPVDDRTAPDTTDREGHPTRSIWPSVYPTILDLIRAHRSTFVFSSTRGIVERLAQLLAVRVVSGDRD